jgi:hypothetical protein
MTAERAEAYGRVMAIIEAAAELRISEARQLRGAADALLFAEAPGVETAEALSETQAVGHALVDSGRWSAPRAGTLMAAMRGCGPEGLPAWAPSRGEQRFARRSHWLRARR